MKSEELNEWILHSRHQMTVMIGCHILLVGQVTKYAHIMLNVNPQSASYNNHLVMRSLLYNRYDDKSCHNVLIKSETFEEDD